MDFGLYTSHNPNSATDFEQVANKSQAGFGLVSDNSQTLSAKLQLVGAGHRLVSDVIDLTGRA